MKHELKPFNELFLAAISPNTSLIPLTGNKKAFTHAQFTNEQLSAMWMLFVSACSGNTSSRGATPQSAAGLFWGASVVTTIGDMTLVLVLVLGLVLVLFAASLMEFLLHSRRLLFFFFLFGGLPFRFGYWHEVLSCFFQA